MDLDLNPGQLYNVHNEIKIYTKYWLGLLTYFVQLGFSSDGVVTDEKSS
jgi:hypothetical protein